MAPTEDQLPQKQLGMGPVAERRETIEADPQSALDAAPWGPPPATAAAAGGDPNHRAIGSDPADVGTAGGRHAVVGVHDRVVTADRDGDTNLGHPIRGHDLAT